MRRICCLASVVFVLAAGVASAQNLVMNGDFEAGKPPWEFFSDAGGDFDIVGGTAEVDIPAQGVNTQLFQRPLPLQGGVEYEITFTAWNRTRANKNLVPALLQSDPKRSRSDKTHFAPEGSLLVAIARHGAPYDNYGLREVANLSGVPTKFVFRFTTPANPDDARLRFSFSAEFGEFVYLLDNVVLRALTCGNGALDPTEQCDDGNLDPGDGCDESCRTECHISYAAIDPDTEALLMAGRGICTLGGPAAADPEVFIGTRSGDLVQLPVQANGSTFIIADVSSITPLDQATHKVIVICPGVGKEIDVSVGTSAETFSAEVACTDAMLCSVTAECPSGEILSGTWSFDGNLGDVGGGVGASYSDTSYTVTLQGPSGFPGSTLSSQIRCSP